ncbi:hypothetical protein V8B97DRAFT_2067841 [Scleroderma yunnanense]
MTPNPIPPPLTPSHHRQLLIAVACFSSLCSYYTLNIMSTPVNLKGKQPTRNPGKPHITWNHIEVLCLLQYLIKMCSKIGDALTFPTMVCEAAAAHITQEFPTRPKITANVEYKWHELKRTYNAIKSYRNYSGMSWDIDSGANIQSASKLANWKEWVTTKEGKLMASFQNQGWNYYHLMHQIAPAGGMQGAGTYQGMQNIASQSDEDDIQLDDPTSPTKPTSFSHLNISEGASLSDVQAMTDCTSTLSLNNLLSLAYGITSTNAGEQAEAICDSVSLYSRVKSHTPSSIINTNSLQSMKCTFDIVEESSQTSWNLTSPSQSFKSPTLHEVTSTSSWGQHGATPASLLGHHTGMDHQSVISSLIHASKQGHMSGLSTRISQAAAVMNMVGAINRMGDIIENALGPPSTEPPSMDYLVMAYQNLVNDTTLTMLIRSFMGLLFLNKTQEDVHKMYAMISDSTLHCSIAQLLFDQRAQCSASSLSGTPFPAPPKVSHLAAIPPPSPIAGPSVPDPLLSGPLGVHTGPDSPFNLDAFIDWDVDLGTAEGGGSHGPQ